MSDHHPSSFIGDANLRLVGSAIGLTSTSIVQEIAQYFGDRTEEDDFRELHVDTVPMADDATDGPRIIERFESGRTHYIVEVVDEMLVGRSLRIHLRKGRMTPRLVEAYSEQQSAMWRVRFDDEGKFDDASISGGQERPTRSAVEFVLSTVKVVDTALRHMRGQ